MTPTRFAPAFQVGVKLPLAFATAALLVLPRQAQGVLPTMFSSAGGWVVGARLHVNTDSPEKRQADAWRATRPQDARLMDQIASQPIASWFGGWNADVRKDVAAVASRSASSAAVPVLVAYNIPGRDCGSHSAGGERSAAGYRRWIADFAAGLGGRQAIVVLEPDALAQLNCLSRAAAEERLSLIREAVSALKKAGAAVYVDAGHAKWIPAATMADRLNRAGIAQADGFSLNVSNFIQTSLNVGYGESVSRLVGGKHFIIDTGRNGAGDPKDGEWCNPRGQALGAAPTTRTGHALVDAYLWIKTPGESDGACNGGPTAGKWWADYALELARNSARVLASR